MSAGSKSIVSPSAAVVVSNHVSPPGAGSQVSLKTVIRLPKLPANQLNTSQSAANATEGPAASSSSSSFSGKKNKKSLRKLEQQQQAILSKQQELHNQALDEYDMDLIDNPHHRVKRPKIVTPTPPAKSSMTSLRGASPSSLLMTVPGSEVPSADESEASSSDMGHHSVGGKTSPDSSSSLHRIDDKLAE